MRAGRLTKKEEEVLRDLLLERGITHYQLFELSNEGKSLPGSTFPDEVESISGWVITPEKVHTFWLDWVDGHYTLGEEDGGWHEVDYEKLGSDRIKMIQIQQLLRREAGLS